MFLLDTLDNLPRMRISNSLMNVFLWILREGGARDVPSLYHLRQAQVSLRKSTGVPTTQHESPKGNVYSMNDPRTLVAMVRNMTVFKDGTFIIPVRWLEDEDGNVCADAYAVKFDHQVRKISLVIVFNLRC